MFLMLILLGAPALYFVLKVCFKPETPEKDEHFKKVQSHIPEFLNSNRNEFRMLGKNLENLMQLLEQNKISYEMVHSHVLDTKVIITSLNNISHYQNRNDRKLIKSNIIELTNKINKRLQAYS